MMKIGSRHLLSACALLTRVQAVQARAMGQADANVVVVVEVPQ